MTKEHTSRYHEKPTTCFAPNDALRRKQPVTLPLDVIITIFRERLEFFGPKSDPDAVAQHAACEIERAMGVFPNIHAQHNEPPPSDGRPEHWTEALALTYITGQDGDDAVTFARMFAEGDWQGVQRNFPAFGDWVESHV